MSSRDRFAGSMRRVRLGASRWRSPSRGAAVGLFAVALVAMLGALALGTDLSRVAVAAQRCQDLSDAAARSATYDFPSVDYAAADQRIADNLAACSSTTGIQVTHDPAETLYYTEGDSVPGYGVLGSYDEGVTVTTHATVPFYFATALGLTGTTVHRRATSVIIQAAGATIDPIWVDNATPFNYGVEYPLHMAESPCYPGIPGNFGWLTPLTGSNDFEVLLSGTGLTDAMISGNYVTVGNTVYGLTGQKVGQWADTLKDRIARASLPPYTYDTMQKFHKGNPRLLIIPAVDFQGGTGSGAQFVIRRFAVFYLESVNQGQKQFYGGFVKYAVPSTPGSPGNAFTGLWTSRLVN